MNPYNKRAVLANQLDSHTNFQALEDCYTVNPKANNYVRNVTKNSKKANNHRSEVVMCTSIDNSFQIQKNWHRVLILHNIYMNKNPKLVVHSGNLVTTNWNESSLLD